MVSYTIPILNCWVEDEKTVRALDKEGNYYTYKAHEMETADEAHRFARHIRDCSDSYDTGIHPSFWRKD